MSDQSTPSHTPNTHSISLTNPINTNTISTIQHTDNEQNTQPPHLRQPTIQPQSGDLQFGDTLWDQFELIYQRITKGRHDIKYYQSYLEQRVTIERTYAKALIKSVESNIHELEAPCTDYIECYSDVRNSTLSTAKTHEDTALLCIQISTQLKDVINELKSSKTRLKDAYDKLCKDKLLKKQQHDKLRDQYIQSVKQAEDNVAIRDQSRGKVAEKKYIKLDEAVRESIRKVEDVTHPQYKRSVDQLHDIQRKYDSDIILMMNEFQRIETKRLQDFQAAMITFANIYSAQQKLFESIYTRTSQNLQKVDIRNDVQEFIKQYQTNKSHEPYVQYIPQRSTIIGHAVDNSSTSPINNISNGLSTTYINTPTNNIHAVHVPIQASAPLTPANHSNNITQQQQYNSPISNVTPVTSTPINNISSNPTPSYALALYDFAPSEPDELPFKQGELITLVKYNDNEDWWQGTINERTGLFPKNYVAKQNHATKQFIDQNGTIHTHGTSSVQPIDSISTTTTSAPITTSSSNATTIPSDVEQPKLMNASCTSLYDFDGQDADELTFKSGQKLIITGELNGWYLGRLDNDTRVGIFPSNYVSLDK